MTSSSSPTPPSSGKKRKWLRWLLGLFGGAIILIVALYFVVTSSAFFTGFILPRVSSAIHAKVTASSAAIHPFRQVILRDLKVQAKGQPALVTAPEVRLDYSLADILHGNIHLDDVALTSPTIQLVTQPNGTDNLTPILNALKSKPTASKTASPVQPAKPLQIDLRKLTLSNLTVLKIKNYVHGRKDLAEVTNLNLTLANVRNGQTGTLTLSADALVNNNPPAPGTNGLMAATVQGKFKFSLTPDLKPGSASGQLQLNVTRATDAYAGFAALGANLNCDVTPTDIRQIALRFTRGSAGLGELSVSGPFDAQKMTGRLQVSLTHLDQQVLNLAGAASGLDFGPTTINATNLIQLANGGNTITATGGFNANQFQVTRDGQTTPALDLHARYDVTVNRTAQTAQLRQLSFAGTQNGHSLLNAVLTQPMNLAWGQGASPVGSASLNVALTHLNLADWRPFTGGLVPAGDANLNLKATAQAGGKQIAFALGADVNNLTVRLGNHTVSQANIRLQTQGQATDMKLVNLKKYQVQLDLQNQSALAVSGDGTYNLGDGSADLQVSLQAALARLLGALPQSGMSLGSGNLGVTAHIIQKQKTQTVTGNLTWSGLSGQIAKTALNNSAGNVSLEVSHSPVQILIRKLTGRLSQNGRAGGAFALDGTYRTDQQSGSFKVNLAGLNQNAVGPFLQPMLANKKLVSVDINAALSGTYDARGSSSVKGGLQVTNLVVNDPQHTIPATPLAATLQVNVAMQKQSAQVHQLQIALTPTSRAQNQLQLQGQVNFAQTNAISGQLKLTANSLDFTRYYDLFAGHAKTAAPPAASSAKPVTAGSVSPELQPIHLPFQNFKINAAIGKCYLHEVEITNLVADVNLAGGHVKVNPLQFALNGAPVSASADLNLGVPGWAYGVAFNARGIPIKPLADTFAPSTGGRYQGQVFAAAQIQGWGTTGTSLRKSLKGQITFDLTNANIRIIPSQTKIFFIPINVQLIATLLNVPEIMQSPITGAHIKMQFANGRINAQQAEVVSPAFLGNVHGVIPIADELTNSPLNLPVDISLVNSLASRLTLSNPQSASVAGYTQLPGFLTVSGTIGKPEARKNALVLTALTARAASGLVGGLVGGKVGAAIKTGGSVVQGLEGLFGGHKTQTTNSTPATNAPPAKPFNPLNLFR